MAIDTPTDTNVWPAGLRAAMQEKIVHSLYEFCKWRAMDPALRFVLLFLIGRVRHFVFLFLIVFSCFVLYKQTKQTKQTIKPTNKLSLQMLVWLVCQLSVGHFHLIRFSFTLSQASLAFAKMPLKSKVAFVQSFQADARSKRKREEANFRLLSVRSPLF